MILSYKKFGSDSFGFQVYIRKIENNLFAHMGT